MERKIVLFSIIFAFIYLSSLALAMLYYGGGSLSDSNSSGFNFTYNYISDLSRLTSLNGKLNHLSAFIYLCGCIFLSLSLLFFIYAFSQHKKTRLTKLGKVTGYCCGIACFFGGIFFFDVFYSYHLIMGYIFNLSGILTMCIFTLSIFQNKDYPNKYGYLLLIILIPSIFYSVLFMLVNIGIIQYLVLLLIIQKIVHIIFVFTLILQNLWLLRYNELI